MSDENEFTAIFDKSEKYKLIETYGIDCYTEKDDGLHFTFGYTNETYIIGWLLGFGDKVTVISPPDLVKGIQETTKNILARCLT